MNKGFDAVAWMRERRTAIDVQNEGLTWREQRDRTLEALEHDPVWTRLKKCVVPPHAVRSGSRSSRCRLSASLFLPGTSCQTRVSACV